MRWLLDLHNRMKIFQKVLVANAAIVTTGALGTVALTHWMLSGHYGAYPLMIPFMVAWLVVTVAVNYGLLRLAFWPLFRLQEVIESIRAGDFAARSPRIAGDPDVARLTETFNLMLDRLEDHRQSVSSQILKSLEEERKRIARELHDETSQALTSLIIDLERVENELSPGELRQRVARSREFTVRTLEEIRRLTFDLRPSILDDLGLVPALRWYVKNKLQPAGLQVALQVEGLEERLPEELEITLYRIVQEASTNVVRHAQARAVAIRLRARRGHIWLQVEDDGKGFDVAAVLSTGIRDRGLGLFGMQERAVLVGGILEVEARSGRGTRVTAVVPLRDSDNAAPVAEAELPAAVT